MNKYVYENNKGETIKIISLKKPFNKFVWNGEKFKLQETIEGYEL